jgi:SAM-dependent methyltransferase
MRCPGLQLTLWADDLAPAAAQDGLALRIRLGSLRVCVDFGPDSGVQSSTRRLRAETAPKARDSTAPTHGTRRSPTLRPPMSPSNLEILAYESTPLGELCLRRRELLSRPGTLITEITLDHELLMTSYNTVSERALVQEALARHSGRDLSVLVGGLGLGYTASEALQSAQVKRVVVIELLPEVIGFLRDGLIPLSTELVAQTRLDVREGDLYATLRGSPGERWDLVLIDVDHSPEEPLGGANESFYSESGLAQAKQHLAPGGILAVWSYAESSPFVEALRASFECVEVVPVSFENDLVDERDTDWLFLAYDPPSGAGRPRPRA